MAHVEDRWMLPGPDGKKVRSDRYGRGSRWLAVWTEPGGSRRKKAFDNKDAAKVHLDRIASEQRTGTYVTAERSAMTVREWGQQWHTSRVDLRPSTEERNASILKVHVYPRWGDTSLGDITHEAVQVWVGMLDVGAVSTRKRVWSVFSAMLNAAVRSKRLGSNPALGVQFGKAKGRRKHYLTVPQVDALVAAMPERWRDWTLFLAFTGLRVGEAAELRARDVNLVRRRVNVTATVALVGGRRVVSDSTKTPAGVRSVPLVDDLLPILRSAIADKGPEEYVFTSERGKQVDRHNWSERQFKAAKQATGLAHITPHDLRHTAVSLAISAGANVKAIQRMVGHASAAMTLDEYAELFDDDLDHVGVALSALISQKRQPPGSPQAA